MKKRMLSIMLALCGMASLVPARAVEEGLSSSTDPVVLAEIDMSDSSTWPTSGTWGGFTWSMDTRDTDNFILTISGNGDLPDLDTKDESKPWYPWRVDTVRLEGPITAIGANNFRNWAIRSINLPSTLTRIGESAFVGAGMERVDIPWGVTEIGKEAFNSCTMKQVDIPATVTTIGDYAFWGSDLTSVDIPNSVTELGEGAFEGSALSSVVWPDSLDYIPERCFYKTKLQYFEIPSHVTEIGTAAFTWSQLREIHVPETVKELGSAVFHGSALRTAVMAADIDVLPSNTFSECDDLRWVDIQSEVTVIDGAFSNMSHLETLILPETVEEVRGAAWSSQVDSIFVRGPGVNQNNGVKREGTFVNPTAEHKPTIYFIPGQEGWAGLEEENCSDTMWFGYPLGTWDGESLTGTRLEQDTKEYYGIPDEVFFCIVDPANKHYPPPTGFDLQIGEAAYNTGTSDRITVSWPDGYGGDVVFSREGYLTYHMPAFLVRAYNWIALRADDGGDSPVVQSILMNKSNLFLQSMDVMEMEEDIDYFYADVLWRDGEEGRITLEQGGKVIAELKNRTMTPVQAGMRLSAGEDVYIVCRNSSHAVANKLRLNIRAAAKEIDVDLGDTFSANTGTECEALSNAQIGLEILGEAIPMSVKFDGEKVEALIGVSLSKTEADAYYKKTKELVDKAKVGVLDPGSNVFSRANTMFSVLNGKKNIIPERHSRFGVETDLQFLGCYEGRMVTDEDGTRHLETTYSKMLVKLEGEVSYTQQFFFWGAPLYWSLGIQAALEAALKLNEVRPDTFDVPPIVVNSRLGVFAEGGVGIPDMVKVGVRGDADFLAYTYFPVDMNKSTLMLNGDIYVVVSLFGLEGHFLKDNEEQVLEDAFVFFQDGVWFPAEGELRPLSLADAGGSEADPMQLHWISRAYLEQGVRFTANEDRVSLLDLTSAVGTVSAKTLVENNYPDSRPQIITLDNGYQVLVWAEDDGTGENGTALQYSVYNKRTWSQPAAVDADGTSDYTCRLKLLDGTLYLVWVDAGEAPSGDEIDLEVISAGMEIAVARFDPETLTFEPAQQLGVSSQMDLLPDLTLYQGQPVCAWISSEQSILSLTESSLYMAIWDGENWDTRQVADGLRDVDSLCLTTRHGAAAAFFTQCSGDQLSAQNKELYRADCFLQDGELTLNGKVVRMTENEVCDTDPEAYRGLVYWYQDGALVHQGGDRLDLGGSADYQILDDGDETRAVIYSRTQNGGTTNFYAILDHGTGWGESALIASSTGWVDDWSATFDSSGNFVIVLSERTLEENYELGSASISAYTVKPFMDMSLSELFYDWHTLMEGETLTAYVTVTNNGLKSDSSFELRGYFDGSSTYAGRVSGLSLNPGESCTVAVNCTVPEGGASSLTVKLSGISSDQNQTDNELTCQLAQQDLSVEQVTAQQTPDGRVDVTVAVVNRGLTTSGGGTLTLRRVKEETRLNIQPEWEDLSESVNLEEMAPGAMDLYSFCLTDGVEPGDIVYAVLDGLTEENMAANNRDFNIVAAWGKGELSVENTVLLSVEASEDSVLLAVDNYTDEPVEGMVVAACYDGGAMKDLKMVPMTLKAGESLAERIDLACPQDGQIRVYALDKDCIPLCKSVILAEER